jgi:predicted XRE-type DNA-binding protein
MGGGCKPVEFRGSVLDDLPAFPASARREAGHQIDRVLQGRNPQRAPKTSDLGPRCQTRPGLGKGTGPASTKRLDGVRDAIGGTQAQAENMRLRSSLMIALKEHIAREGLSQREAAKVFGVTQPRVSNLTRGKVELFGLDSLVNMLAAAGLRVEMRVAGAA